MTENSFHPSNDVIALAIRSIVRENFKVLLKQGINIGCKRVARLLKKAGPLVYVHPSSVITTTVLHQ